MSTSGIDHTASLNREEICARIVNAGNEFATVKQESVTLMSGDGIKFEVPLALAEQSKLVKTMVEDGLTSAPLPTIAAPTVERMISFWAEHQESDMFTPARKDAVRDWEKKFFDEMNRAELFAFSLAANYMDSKEMLDSTCSHIADMVKDMRIQEVRDFFGIENDYTPEEEQQLREENKWAFDGTEN